MASICPKALYVLIEVFVWSKPLKQLIHGEMQPRCEHNSMIVQAFTIEKNIVGELPGTQNPGISWKWKNIKGVLKGHFVHQKRSENGKLKWQFKNKNNIFFFLSVFLTFSLVWRKCHWILGFLMCLQHSFSALLPLVDYTLSGDWSLCTRHLSVLPLMPRVHCRNWLKWSQLEIANTSLRNHVVTSFKAKHC